MDFFEGTVIQRGFKRGWVLGEGFKRFMSDRRKQFNGSGIRDISEKKRQSKYKTHTSRAKRISLMG